MSKTAETWQKLHNILLIKVAQFLKNENKDDVIIADMKSHNRPTITLKSGKPIYPDIINETKKIIYKVHVDGERKEEYFNDLPEGWKAVNVFYDEALNTETLVVKLDNFKIQRIKWC